MNYARFNPMLVYDLRHTRMNFYLFTGISYVKIFDFGDSCFETYPMIFYCSDPSLCNADPGFPRFRVFPLPSDSSVHYSALITHFFLQRGSELSGLISTRIIMCFFFTGDHVNEIQNAADATIYFGRFAAAAFFDLVTHRRKSIFSFSLIFGVTIVFENRVSWNHLINFTRTKCVG